MNDSKAMFTSNSDEYSTPDALFESLNDEFDFTLDPCATHENHKCLAYYTSAENGLNRNWGGNECSAIPRIARYPIGCGNAMRKALRTGRLSLC